MNPDILAFLLEMSGKTAYADRKFKGIINRQEEAKRLLSEVLSNETKPE